MIIKGADYRYVKNMDDGARETQHKAVILHTNGGKVPISGDLYNWWRFGAAPGVGAQIQVTKDGDIFQYLDTKRFTGHAWDANHWSVGVETEDDGNPDTPWTKAQIDAIVGICKQLGVPPKLLKETPSSGVGWHEQFASWNKSGHICPDGVREKQITNVIIPALAGGGGFLMSLSDEEQEDVKDSTNHIENAFKGMGAKWGIDMEGKGAFSAVGQKLAETLDAIAAKP